MKKQACRVFLAAMLAALSGCSNLDFYRYPLGRIDDSMDSGKPFVKEDDGRARARSRQLATVLAEWQKQGQGLDMDYRVGTDDILTIDVMSLEEHGKKSTIERQVTKSGTILMPLAGDVRVAGQTPSEIRDTLTAAYAGKYLKEPQVLVAVKEYNSALVVVTGAVQKPGIYRLRRGASSALEMISEAGGLGASAGDVLYIHRGTPADAATNASPAGSGAAATSGPPAMASATTDADGKRPGAAVPTNSDLTVSVDTRLAIDLKLLVDQGDTRLNLAVRAGDILTVPPKAQELIYVLGYVRNPGPLALYRDQDMGALNALAMAGGLATAGRGDQSYLVRDTPSGKQVIDVNLTKVIRGVRPDVRMKAGDTLVIGTDFLSRLTEIVRPSISAGVSAVPSLAP